MEWWVINISQMNVCLSDLGITIPAGRSWNLLDAKHFSFNIDELEKSKKDGSLFKKRDKIRIGKTHQQIPEKKRIELSSQPIQTRNRSAIKIDNPNYEDSDWLFSDEEYAEEMSKEWD